MRYLVALLLVLAPLSASADGLKQTLIQAIEDAVGPPGNPIGDKSQVVAVNADGDVTFAFLCSAGKEDGAGDQLVDSIFDVLNGATGGVSVLLKPRIKRAIEKGVVNEGDAYCSVLATKTGSKSRASNVKNGSIYTTSWKNGVEVTAVTDRRACKKIHRRYVCFEVAEGPSSSTGEIDGVSGCFQAEVDGTLVSYSFGRGETIPDEVSATFSVENSKSDKSCVDRKLGKNIF